MNDALLLLGRLHPLVLHAPLGSLAALIALELWSAARRRELEARRALAVFAALTGIAAAGSGWLLAADGYGGELLFRHRWAGVTLAALLSVAALCARPRLTRAYLGALLLAGAAAGLAGHWGASITHGPNYFALDTAPAPRAAAPTLPDPDPDPEPEPQTAEPRAALPVPAETPVEPELYGEQIAPILAEHCTACHGPAKQKARLALDTPAGLAAGGFGGPVVLAGDPDGSELLRRLRLAPEDDEHMPPANQPQPSAEQIERIESWIRAGAPLPAGTVGAPPPEPVEGAGGPAPATPGSTGSAGAGPAGEALARLLAERVHAEWLEPAAELLWVDCSGRPDADDALLTTWLAPLAEHVAELSLAGTAVSDAGLALAARMPRLERLDLARTHVTAGGLGALGSHPRLRVLNVSGTSVDDSLLALELPALERLFCFGSALTAEGLERGSAARPGLVCPGREVQRALEIEDVPLLGAEVEREPEPGAPD